MKLRTILLLCLLLAVGIAPAGAKWRICYMGTAQGNAVSHDDTKYVDGLVATQLSQMNRIDFVDVSALGVNTNDKTALWHALLHNNVDYLVSLRLDSVVVKEKRQTRKTKDGGSEDYWECGGRTNYDITFTQVKTGKESTYKAYSESFNGLSSREEARTKAMEEIQEGIVKFVNAFFPVYGTLVKANEDKTALIDIGRADGLNRKSKLGIYDKYENLLGRFETKEILGGHATEGEITKQKDLENIRLALENGETLVVVTESPKVPIFHESQLKENPIFGSFKDFVNGIETLRKKLK